MSRPFVSVLIDTYNHERFIEQAVVSALEQDFAASDREIIVVDDGSTDRTPEILRKFEPKIRVIRKENGGQASAFNVGIPECRGEIVAFLDGDDWWEKNKLQGVVQTFVRDPLIGAVGHAIYEVDETGKRLFVSVPNRVYVCHLRNQEEVQEFLDLRSYLGTSRLAVRRSIFANILPVPQALVVEADEFLATLAVAQAGCIVLDQPLTNYRLHSGNQFQFVTADSRKLERKFNSLDCLVKELPARLRAAGIDAKNIELLTIPNWIEATRSRLALGRGWPWETVAVERRAFHRNYQHVSFGYKIFRAAVLAAATVLPPRMFYDARNWYASRRVDRLRRYAGTATPVNSLTLRKAPNA